MDGSITSPSPDPRPKVHPGADLDGDGIADLLQPIVEESYLYERVIDALIAFVARFLRTAGLLLLRRRRAEVALLAALDQDSPRLMRPLAFVALTYIVFVMIASAVLGIGADEFTGATNSVFGTFGEAEVDILLLAILVPLPLVLVVAGASHAAAGRLVGASRTARAHLAAMMQYAVAQSLWVLSVVLIAASMVGLAVMRADAAGFAGPAVVGQLDLLAIAVLVVGGGGFVAAILASMPPVYRALAIVPGLPRIAAPRRLVFSFFGPVTTLVSIGVVSAMLEIGSQLEEPMLRFHVAEPLATRDASGLSLRGDAVVTLAAEEPIVLLDVAALWQQPGADEVSCDDLVVDHGPTATGVGTRVVPGGAPLAAPALVLAGRTDRLPPPFVIEADGGQWVRYQVRLPDAVGAQLLTSASSAGERDAAADLEGVSGAERSLLTATQEAEAITELWTSRDTRVDLLRPAFCVRTSAAPNRWLPTRR